MWTEITHEHATALYEQGVQFQYKSGKGKLQWEWWPFSLHLAPTSHHEWCVGGTEFPAPMFRVETE